MSRNLAAALTLLVLGLTVPSACAPATRTGAARGVVSSETEVIHVAPSTGERETDRASILAALDQVRPGGTVEFGPGQYLVGPIIRIDTPGITLLGHADGTVLRGCELDEYEAMEVDFIAAFERDGFDVDPRILGRCGQLHLTGGNVTVRGFTFEQSRLGLVLGCCEDERVLRSFTGGYLIEENTFRNTGNGIRAWVQAEETTVIRGNEFTNTYHALSAGGSRIHFVGNRVTVPDPASVPFETHPGFGIAIAAYPAAFDSDARPPIEACIENVISDNHIEGHPDAVLLIASPGTTCRDNVVQDNTLLATRVARPEVWRFEGIWPINDPDDPTFVGLPLWLWGDDGATLPPEFIEEGLAPGRVEGTRVEGNRILGAEGLGIQLINASRNQIVGNTISQIRVRDPFPGNAPGAPTGWTAANGSGIWLSPGSDENEIIGNTFEQVAGQAIFLEGDRNRVETRSASDNVRDLGSENEVGDAGSAARDMIHGDPGSPAPRDTLLGRIASLDAQYFEAYNRCALDALDAFHLPDLEAYHDLGGGPVGRETVRQGLERGVCAAPGRIRRALVPGTLAVYPMAQFGAIQLADHLFFEAGEDGAERVVTAARMIALWRDTPGGWKISRMISYDHRPPLPEDGPPVPPDGFETRIIEVDGHAVHVYTSGWEHLERGQPVVVFEGGGFSTLDAWGDLPARLARETAVVAYDRAGSGRSEWDGQRPTLDHVTSRLRRILEVLDAPPPYIHVGHSFGGPLGFDFARQYPDELAGLVLVDPTPPAADWLGAFDDIGVGRAGHDEFDELFSRAFEGAPESLLLELDFLSSYLSAPDASPWSPPDLSVPVAVLLAGAGYEVPPDLPSTFDLDQQHQALLLRQVANYADWTRTVPDATLIVANNSRHCIHCWDPELVIGAIRRVLYSDVRVQLRQAMAADGISAIERTYDALRSRYPDSHFEENRLESLGRELLGFGESEAAVAVFELNAREYPDVVRTHESLGDAYRAAGRLDDARGSYERASQLAEANASARLPALRRKLEGVEREQQRSRSDSSQDNDRR